MAGPTLSRFLGLFRLRDASDPTRLAAVGADGAVKVAPPSLVYVTATVPDADNKSNVIDCRNAKLRGIILPGNYHGITSLKFSGCRTSGGTFGPVMFEGGDYEEVLPAAVDGTYLRLPDYLFEIEDYLKLRTQTSSGGATDFILVLGA